MEGDLIRTNTWLTPLACIYGWLMSARNLLFDWGVLESRQYDIPVISVGNITVGGTGKTPHIEYLVSLLSGRYRVAVLSRGYKRKSRGYVLATPDTPMEMIGDEPWQMAQKFRNIYVAVDADRRHGIERLMTDKETCDVQVILLDDAFQHRYVTPGKNILLTDYHRLITRDAILPAGRLRESAHGKERANMVIVTKCPENLSPMEYRIVAESLQLRPYQQLFFSTVRYGRLVNVLTHEIRPMSDMKHYNVLLLTGIGCPGQMKMDLNRRFASITPLNYADHHYYTDGDMDTISAELEALPQPRMIITTEKDVTRLMSMQSLPDRIAAHIWVLPIGIRFMQGKERIFNDKITGYVQKNIRNRGMAQSQNDDKA
ncbi:MAG: tetraacyldisaccharide 4'-kinase [Bacteroidaceae bacterium]|nr:tetraacyldisaccharide 4'-kinase [Bacteroidaceae bacterium]